MANALVDAGRYCPGCSEGTLVTMPANGAFTTVWSSWRAASSRCARHLQYCGCCSTGVSGSPLSDGGDAASC